MNDYTSICLITRDSPYSDMAINFIKQNFSNYTIVKGDFSEPTNAGVLKRKFDYIISFLNPRMIPEDILKNARCAAVNFHPGPPEYPGAGCYNFALYNNDKMFGTTCHHMKKKADSGKIVSVKRFPMFESDTVMSLRERTMTYTLLNFFELIYPIIEGKDIPTSDEEWKREPRTQKDLNELLQISLDMPTEEIDRRIRATAHGEYPGPYIEIHGKKYTLKSA